MTLENNEETFLLPVSQAAGIAISCNVSRASGLNNNNTCRNNRMRRLGHGPPRRKRNSLMNDDVTLALPAGDEFSRAASGEINPSMRSLLVPWSLIAMVALVSSVVTTSTTLPFMLSFFHDDARAFQWQLGSTSQASSSALANPWDSMLTKYDTETGRELYVAEDDYPSQEQGTANDNDAKQQQHNEEQQRDDPPPSQTARTVLPFSTRDYIGFFFATLGIMVAAGGGIGGGGILVPIFILVLGFSPKHAIPLSNVTVLGGALANTVLNTRKRHPLADRPLVDWDLILVMEPLTIGGALIGAFLNKVLPETFLTVLLVALLSFTAHDSLKRAFKMYRIETLHLKEQGFRPDGTKESELTRLSHEHDVSDEASASGRLLGDAELQESDIPENQLDQDDSKNDKKRSKPPSPRATMQSDDEAEDFDEVELFADTSKSKREILAEILEEERHVSQNKILVLVGVFVVVLFINLLKGGGAFKSPLGITCGSRMFWLANAAMLIWIIVISLFIRTYLVNRWKIKQLVGYEYVEGDIQWDGRATLVYPTVCCLAGFFAGMFGIGGGIVKGPLMLAMGVHPAVSSASSAVMILFTSFTATTSFVVFGLMIYDYALLCFSMGFLATLVGQVGLTYLMKKYQRNSYIVFSIGGVVLLSAFLMTIQSLWSMAEGGTPPSGGICGKS